MNDQQALENDYEEMDFTSKEYSATIDYLRQLRLFSCQDLRDEKVKHPNTFILTGDSRFAEWTKIRPTEDLSTYYERAVGSVCFNRSRICANHLTVS